MNLYDRVLLLLNNKMLLLILGFISLILSCYLVFYIPLNTSLLQGVALISSGTSPEYNTLIQEYAPVSEDLLTVYITGAIYRPGVYQLPVSSRLGDLLTKAGGLSNGVDIKFASSTLNLAAKLSDGTHIHIPWNSEVLLETDTNIVPVSSDYTEDLPDSNDNLVNLNLASKEELMSIKGIGETYADRIIKSRPIDNYTALGTSAKIPKNLLDYLTNNTKL